jgi:hypothetical protein
VCSQSSRGAASSMSPHLSGKEGAVETAGLRAIADRRRMPRSKTRAIDISSAGERKGAPQAHDAVSWALSCGYLPSSGDPASQDQPRRDDQQVMDESRGHL